MARLKILLVDDETDFRKTMGAIIEGWGYDLIEAPNGKEAIDALKKEKPAIIILDYLMPGMDGIVTLKEIRGIDKKIPVIMFTAHPDIKVIEGSGNLGVSAFIPKLSVHSDTQFALKTAIDMVEKKLKKQKGTI